MLAQQHTTAQLLELLAQCQQALGEVRAGMAQGAAVLLLQEGEAEAERARTLRSDREGLLAEFRCGI